MARTIIIKCHPKRSSDHLGPLNTRLKNAADKHHSLFVPGGVKARGSEPKTGLDRVFNFNLGCFDDVRVLIYEDACPHL
jgi:hypothetical protein